MTLGGLAVAIGMVVDDAIVDVENVFRRLRENAALPHPASALQVIASASGEVRNSILYATVLIILVFLPLLGLTGVEGKLFAPDRHRHDHQHGRVLPRLADADSRALLVSAQSQSGCHEHKDGFRVPLNEVAAGATLLRVRPEPALR
jgi:hypothetical protein